MLTYFIRRILEMIPVLLVVSLLIFGFIKLLPGDPARIYAGQDASLQAVESARQLLGLNDPLPAQYWHWLSGVFRGDLELLDDLRGQLEAEFLAERFT